jgi:hypothetical protein
MNQERRVEQAFQACIEGADWIGLQPPRDLHPPRGRLPNRETSKILSIGKNCPIGPKSLKAAEIYFRQTWRVYPSQIAILNI